MAELKKVAVYPYRCANSDDCSCNGVTARNNRMWLFVDCTEEEAIKWCEENHADPKEQLIVIRREFPVGKESDYAVPLVYPKGKWIMFGGNFVYTSDSRFSEYCGDRPLPVHDRIEEYLK